MAAPTEHPARLAGFLVASLLASTSFAPQATYQPPPWTYQTRQLNSPQMNTLLAKPKQVVVIDVHRPDELISKGSFPVFLNIQVSDVEKSLGYIPKDRVIVSNPAHRVGAVGDLLVAKGYKVAGGEAPGEIPRSTGFRG